MSKPVKNSAGEKDLPQKKKKGKTTEQLMHIHMQDKNHTITAEDIENLDLKLEQPEEITDFTPNLPSEDDGKTPQNADDGKKHITPWDVIEG